MRDLVGVGKENFPGFIRPDGPAMLAEKKALAGILADECADRLMPQGLF
jgi:hypothetical protein